MEFNPDLPGFDDFLYWHSQRTGSHNFNWDDPNHRNAYLAWELQTRRTMSGTEAAPPHAPPTIMMAAQTYVAPRAFGLSQGSVDSRGSIVQMYPQYENPGQVASDPHHQQQDLSSPQRQSEVQSQQQPPSDSQAAQPVRQVESDMARKIAAYEKERATLTKAHSQEICAFDKKQQNEINTQRLGQEQLRAREALLQRHRDENTRLKEDMESNSTASMEAYKRKQLALDQSHNRELARSDIEHQVTITRLNRLDWKPEQVITRRALLQRHRAEKERLKEKHGMSNKSLVKETEVKNSIGHTKNASGDTSSDRWVSYKERYGPSGQWFLDEIRAADDLLPHFRQIWVDTMEIHIQEAKDLNLEVGVKMSRTLGRGVEREHIKQEGKANRIAMYEKQKESRRWIFEASNKEGSRVAAGQPEPEVEMESPRLVAAIDYYTGAAVEQAAAYGQYDPDTVEIDTESQVEDEEAASDYEPRRQDAMEMENQPKYTEKSTSHEQHEMDCIDVETEEHVAENGQSGPQQDATSNDMLPLNSTLVLDLGKPSSNKSLRASKGPSADALVEKLPSNLNQRVNELKGIQAKELSDFDEPFFAMMRDAEGDPSERARASIRWNTNRAEILGKHKQALEIVQARQIDKDKVSAEEQRDRTGLDETIRLDESAGQQIIGPGGPNDNAHVLAENPTGTSGPDEKLWKRRVELEAMSGFNGGRDISNMVRDEAPPYPRCSRCLNLKKGCNRQRPCRRCLDAGVPAQCVTRDTDMNKKPRKNKGLQLQNQSIQNQHPESILRPTTTGPNTKVEQNSDENMAHLPVSQEAGNQKYGPNPTQGQYIKLEQQTPERSCLYEQVNGRHLEPHALKNLEDITQGQKHTEGHQQGILDAVREVSEALIDSPLVYRYAEGLGHVSSAGATTSLARRRHLFPGTIIELANLDAIQLCEKTVVLDVHMQRIAKAKSREERKLAEDNASIALFELGEAHKKQQLDKISKTPNVPTGNEQVLAVVGERSLSGGVGQRPSATTIKGPPPENNLLNHSVRPKEKAETFPMNPLPSKCKMGAGDLKRQAVTTSSCAATNLLPEEFHEELRVFERAQTREMNTFSSRGWRTFLSPKVGSKRSAKEKRLQAIEELKVEHAKALNEFIQKALKKKRPRSESSSPPPESKFPRLEGGELQPMEEPTDLSSSRFTNEVTVGQRYDTSQKTQTEAEQHCINSLAEEFRNSMDKLMKAQAYELAVVRKFHGERCDKAHKAEPDKKAVLLNQREEALISLQDKHKKQREELTKGANEKKRARSQSPSPTRPVKILRLTGECQLVEEPSGRPLGPSRFTKTRQRRSGSMTAKHGSESAVETQLREELREGGKQGHVSNNTHMVGRDRTLLKQEAQKGNEVSTGVIQDLQGQLNGQPHQLPIIQPAVENSSSGRPSPGCPEDQLQTWVPEPLGREAALVRASQYDLARVDWRQAVEETSGNVMGDSKWIGDDLLSVLKICTSKLGSGGEVL